MWENVLAFMELLAGMRSVPINLAENVYVFINSWQPIFISGVTFLERDCVGVWSPNSCTISSRKLYGAARRRFTGANLITVSMKCYS